MAGVINDVESLKKFRGELLDISEDLQEQLKRTDAAIEDVASVWKDSQFKKFNDDFQKDKEMINPLCEDIEAFEGEVLKPLEDILRDYLAL